MQEYKGEVSLAPYHVYSSKTTVLQISCPLLTPFRPSSLHPSVQLISLQWPLLFLLLANKLRLRSLQPIITDLICFYFYSPYPYLQLHGFYVYKFLTKFHDTESIIQQSSQYKHHTSVPSRCVFCQQREKEGIISSQNIYLN